MPPAFIFNEISKNNFRPNLHRKHDAYVRVSVGTSTQSPIANGEGRESCGNHHLNCQLIGSDVEPGVRKTRPNARNVYVMAAVYVTYMVQTHVQSNVYRVIKIPRNNNSENVYLRLPCHFYYY